MSENNAEDLRYAVELAKREEKVIKVDDKNFYDSNSFSIRELEPKKYPDTLHLNTLDSLIDYFKNNVNKINEQKTIVVVDSPQVVYVFTEDDELEERTTLIKVLASLPTISFERFLPIDIFNIELQSKYADDNQREEVIEFASNIIIDNGVDIKDDGIAQVTTIRQGIASKKQGKVPNPVKLSPYRTFLEVEQPTSEFILRLNEDAELALFEADGGAWKLDAVKTVKKYLLDELEEIENVFVLA